MVSPVDTPTAGADRLTRVLEAGLVCVVLLAPLPFGAVTPRGRLALEIASCVLGVLWIAGAAVRGMALPSLAVRIGLAGLLILGILQSVPLHRAVVEPISPKAIEVRQTSLATGDALEIENRLLGRDSRSMEPAPSLSVEPQRTASAVRTGAALALLLLIAVSVARDVGARRIAAALLISAAFQSLYGLLILASGHDMIWNVPKIYYLNSATGTFVNKNHFAGLLEAALPCGLALILSRTRRRGGLRRERLRDRIVDQLGPEGIRSLVLGLLFLVGLAGLLLSLSRTATALGILAILATVTAAGRRGLRARLVAAVLVLAVAAVPLAQLGADRLAERYFRSAEDFTMSGGRAVVWSDTWAMALDFPLVGTGFGTFSTVYPLYRSPEVRLFFDHAHNDVLQAFSEGGVIGMLLLSMILVPVLRRIVGAFSGAGGTVAIGFAAGLMALLLHEIIDFNLHIPSNAAMAAIMAGVLLGLPWNPRT
jgi:O-antigen ligase